MGQITGVAIENIPNVWVHAEPFLEKALSVTDEYDMGDILDNLLRGTQQLWLAGDTELEAVAVTGIQKTVCVIHLCAGEGMNRWLSCIGVIEAWARGEGCEAMEIIGRRGWLKVLPDYKETEIVMRKQL